MCGTCVCMVCAPVRHSWATTLGRCSQPPRSHFPYLKKAEKQPPAPNIVAGRLHAAGPFGRRVTTGPWSRGCSSCSALSHGHFLSSEALGVAYLCPASLQGVRESVEVGAYGLLSCTGQIHWEFWSTLPGVMAERVPTRGRWRAVFIRQVLPSSRPSLRAFASVSQDLLCVPICLSTPEASPSAGLPPRHLALSLSLAHSCPPRQLLLTPPFSAESPCLIA